MGRIKLARMNDIRLTLYQKMESLVGPEWINDKKAVKRIEQTVKVMYRNEAKNDKRRIQKQI